ncbi:MAG: class I SAM-dependent methyltransferase [Rhodopila sp.]|nr:class I SAM-dependent methyltransferase [Rhodopila sp.]
MPDPTSADVQDNAAQIAYWNDKAAVTWTAFQERLDTLFEPITALAIDAAAPAPGEHVIDIGCGCGATVLALASRIGPTGRVVGLDVSEPMSARARERIEAAGLTNAQVILSDAATHVFPSKDADLLFSRFGVMFFADPVAAFANLRQSMRPGGRLLCAAWRSLADNPWFDVPLQAARPLLPPQPPIGPDEPGPFAFANADRTRRILTQGGWRDATLTRHDVPMHFADAGHIDQAAEFATRVGMLARILADADPDVRSRARQAVAEALKAYDGPDGITLSGSIWLLSARA